MKNTFHKTIVRQILNNPRRFIAIMLIVALGVAFYSGVRATSPNMRLTVDKYFDEYNSSDIQVISTMGFDESDIQAISKAENSRIIMPGYSVDGFVFKDDRTLLINFQSINIEKLNNRPETILNRPVLVEGKFPTSKDECVLDSQLKDYYHFELGDTIKIQTSIDPKITDSLNLLEYKIVGFARSVQYISIQRGNSSKGEGSLSGFAFIPEQNFTLDVYTQVFLKADDTGESRFSDFYIKSIDKLKNNIEKIGDQRNPLRYKKIVEEAENELAKGKEEIRDAENKLSDGEKELLNGEKELLKGEEEVSRNRKKYETEIENAQKELNQAKNKLEETKTILEDKQKQLELSKSTLNQAKAEINDNKIKLDQGEQTVIELYTKIADMTSQLELLPADSNQAIQLKEQISQLQVIYDQKSKELEDAKKQYEQGVAQVKDSEQKLIDGETQLKKGWEEYFSGKAEFDKNLSLFNKSKTDGASKLKEAQEKLNKSRLELEKAKKEYSEKKSDALVEIQDARKKLDEGEQQLKKLKAPEWYILDLDKNIGFSGYKQDTDRVAAIGLVFPLIFFLVAALVSLTNMTRIVEDDRSNIGIFKALGYSGTAIATRYLVYAGTATALGIGIGVVVGSALFPRVISDAYGIIYTLPSVDTVINARSSIQAGAGALISTVVPTMLVCYKELIATPASLMRPRAPKLGRRILLERVPIIWNHLNFSQKVTFRNLFRYKKRLLMTILGIAGCTALIFTGFGLKDSIRMMVPLQYDEIQKYDMAVYLHNTVSEHQKTQLDQFLLNNQNVNDFIEFYQAEIEVKSARSTQSANLIVTDNGEKFKDFITLRSRKNNTPVNLSSNGVVITEKLGRMLDLKVGDIVTLSVKEKPDITVKVEGLAENYVLHYIYMTKELYQTLYGETSKTNSVYGRLSDTSSQAEGELSKSLINMDFVSSVMFTSSLRQNFDDMVSAMDIVVVVLILSAAALAFIVLFSLTSINIDERRRELATLKVLGFFDFETNLYLYRESIILTILGIGAGLILGIFMLSFVITTAEVDMVMFTRRTHWLNYVISSLITIGFSATVNLYMSRTINRIDMVESMKSVE